MEIGFVFINYNNSHYTRKAVHSLSLNEKWGNCFVVVVDNNSGEDDIELLKEIKKDYPNIHLILNNDNIGYFKGLNVGIKYLRRNYENINFIIIGNNDLLFPSNFIDLLKINLNIFENFPVISPNIVTIDGVHQNPHVIMKISKFREIIFDIYYFNYFLAIIIKKIAKITNIFTDRKDEKQFGIAQTIYQGCGACYILGPIFFTYFDSLWAPTFLMGEEYFLSKQLSEKNLKIYYEPSIIINHNCHATINKIPGKQHWEISRESHREYRKYVKILSE